MGGWAVAQSPILITTITLKRLEMRGYVAMLDYYTKIAPHLNPACAGLYTRPVRFPKLRECETCLPEAVRQGCSPSVIAGGAVYSISGCSLLSSLFCQNFLYQQLYILHSKDNIHLDWGHSIDHRVFVSQL